MEHNLLRPVLDDETIWEDIDPSEGRKLSVMNQQQVVSPLVSIVHCNQCLNVA